MMATSLVSTYVKSNRDQLFPETQYIESLGIIGYLRILGHCETCERPKPAATNFTLRPIGLGLCEFWVIAFYFGLCYLCLRTNLGLCCFYVFISSSPCKGNSSSLGFSVRSLNVPQRNNTAGRTRKCHSLFIFPKLLVF